jgi:hypothetical protein
MHRLFTVLLALAATAPLPALAETQVGISIGIAQPGVYGRIDIGNAPPPMVVMPQPVIIAPPPQAVLVQRRPIYLYVPPGHQKNWGKHCRRYDACGQPVYFVQERWVQDRYAERRGKGNGKGNGHGHGKGRKDD